MIGLQTVKIIVRCIEAFDANKFRKAIQRAEPNHLETEVGVDASYEGVLQMQ